MKRFVMIAALSIVMTSAASAGDFTYRSSRGVVTSTHCDYHRVYGTSCRTSQYDAGSIGNGPRIINVPEGNDDRSSKPFNCPSCADASAPYVGNEPSW